ncbi:MAG TPA: FtsQ-type POTRA domain-containing protein [Acidobacteriaceae bacterium]|nr:FtsQ-type POTRA domain-containing protein [Acidobacteriaceae bacterium]
MAKTDRYKDRGATLVEDEPQLLRPASAARSRVEKEFLPDGFERFPVKRTGEVGNEARIRRRVPGKKGRLPAWTKTRWGVILSLVIAAAAIAGVAWAVVAARSFLLHDPRFRIETSDFIQFTGNRQLTRDDLLQVFGADIGRNIFYVPLAERRAHLERIPWVERATVMRILPDELRVAIKERTPVAFVRIGNEVKLVDAAGVILDMSPAMMEARHYSFPVVTGIRPQDPLAERSSRMRLYERFIEAIDSGGQHFSRHVSEVDLSDLFDLRATVSVESKDLLLHFGNKDFLARYRIFETHIKGWEQQYSQLAGVDLRYSGEVVLKMGNSASGQGSTAPGGGAKAAATDSKITMKQQDKAGARQGRRAKR